MQLRPPPLGPARRARVLAMCGAAGIVIVGLGAFALLPKGNGNAHRAPSTPHYVQAAERREPPPHMLEAGTPFSFADLVERVSPAVVTVTAETRETDGQLALNSPENLPEPFRDFFNQFGQGRQFQVPRKATSMGSGFIIDKSGYI